MLVASLPPRSYENLNINRRSEKNISQASYSKFPKREDLVVGYYLPFKSKSLSNLEQKIVLYRLEKCKQGKPEFMQKVYDIGKEFISNKITKAEYLSKMNATLINVNRAKAYVNDAELGFTRDFMLRSYIENYEDFISDDDIIESLMELSKQ